MITAYHRPDNRDEALALYRRKDVTSIFVLGACRFGNTESADVEVIDLQNIKVTEVVENDNCQTLDCLISLAELSQKTDCIPTFSEAITRDLNENQKNSFPLSGALYIARSHFVMVNLLMAGDAKVNLLVSAEKKKLEDWLFSRNDPDNRVITSLEISPSVDLSYELISRTPADLPELVIAAGKWKSGRVRVVMGIKNDKAPHLIFDGTGTDGVLNSLQNACSHLFTHDEHYNYYLKTSESLVNRILSN